MILELQHGSRWTSIYRETIKFPFPDIRAEDVTVEFRDGNPKLDSFTDKPDFIQLFHDGHEIFNASYSKIYFWRIIDA